MVKNDKNELAPPRITTRWSMCIHYMKLDSITRNDHFPLPFLDEVLEKVVGHAFYCFLNSFFGDYQLDVVPEDQEKTIFTCPFGTFAF